MKLKIIRPALLAAALIAPWAAAQTPRPDRSVDTDGTSTAVPAERAGAEYDKNRELLRNDISDIKREAEVLRENATERGREKLDALTSRIDELEARTAAAGEGSERDFNENKHKFTNELKKIRRELRSVRKRQYMTPDATPVLPPDP